MDMRLLGSGVLTGLLELNEEGLPTGEPEDPIGEAGVSLNDQLVTVDPQCMKDL